MRDSREVGGVGEKDLISLCGSVFPSCPIKYLSSPVVAVDGLSSEVARGCLQLWGDRQ